MELNINNEVDKKMPSTNDALEFTKELAKSIEMEDLLVYNLPIDNGKFTNDNLLKIDEIHQEVLSKLAKEDNSVIYEVLQTGPSYNIVKEYDGNYDSITTLQIAYDELPKNCKVGMIVLKNNNEYVPDKELTQNVYYKMKEIETDILNEQQKDLKKMRKSGELYYVKKVAR